MQRITCLLIHEQTRDDDADGARNGGDGVRDAHEHVGVARENVRIVHASGTRTAYPRPRLPNRYNRVPQFRLEGDAVRLRHYTGVFDADDLQSLVQLACVLETI